MSRACLGKTITFSIKSRKRFVFHTSSIAESESCSVSIVSVFLGFVPSLAWQIQNMWHRKSTTRSFVSVCEFCIAYLQLLRRLDLRWYDADAQRDFVVLNRQTVGRTYSRKYMRRLKRTQRQYSDPKQIKCSKQNGEKGMCTAMFLRFPMFVPSLSW